MVKLKRVGVFSVAKLQAIIMSFVGLIAGIFIAIIDMMLKSLATSAGIDKLPGAELGFSAIIILPIAYAIFGFIGGAIGAIVYNLSAKLVGGLEMDFAQ